MISGVHGTGYLHTARPASQSHFHLVQLMLFTCLFPLQLLCHDIDGQAVTPNKEGTVDQSLKEVRGLLHAHLTLSGKMESAA